jgi:hypothetical protein
LGDMEQVGRISCAPPTSSGGRAVSTPKPPTLAKIERFIRANVAESKTYHETIDMRSSSMTDMGSNDNNESDTETTGFMMQQEPRETPGPTSALNMLTGQNKALENSTSNPGKADIEWGKSLASHQDLSKNVISDYGIAAEYDIGKGIHDPTKQSVSDRRLSVDLFVSPTGAFSPRSFPSSDLMLSKKTSGVYQHAGRFINAFHEAKPSGLEELAMVANGLREQSLQSSTAI